MTTPTGNDSWRYNKFDPSFLQGSQLTWLSSTTLSLASGNMRDQSAQSQFSLSAPVTINAANIGVANGLDTGALADSSWYYVYEIADSLNFQPTGGLLSLSASAPALPQGYDSFRMVGAVLTDGGAAILKFYQARNYFQWDAPIAVTVTASGTSATYSAMDLSTGVPPINFGKAYLQYKYTCNAAGDSAKFQPTGATGDAQTFLGQVASVALEDSFMILPLLATAKPEVSYKVSAGTLNNVNILGFEMQL